MAKWIKDFASGLIGPVTDLISEVVTDKDKAAELAHRISTMAAEHSHADRQAQIEVNRESAKHASIFVAGARPAAIWVCVFALLNLVVLFPFVTFFAQFWQVQLSMPPIDTALMWGVLSPLLGLGVLRTGEKVMGRARDKINEPSK